MSSDDSSTSDVLISKTAISCNDSRQSVLFTLILMSRESWCIPGHKSVSSPLSYCLGYWVMLLLRFCSCKREKSAQKLQKITVKQSANEGSVLTVTWGSSKFRLIIFYLGFHSQSSPLYSVCLLVRLPCTKKETHTKRRKSKLLKHFLGALKCISTTQHHTVMSPVSIQ